MAQLAASMIVLLMIMFYIMEDEPGYARTIVYLIIFWVGVYVFLTQVVPE